MVTQLETKFHITIGYFVDLLRKYTYARVAKPSLKWPCDWLIPLNVCVVMLTNGIACIESGCGIDQLIQRKWMTYIFYDASPCVVHVHQTVAHMCLW